MKISSEIHLHKINDWFWGWEIRAQKEKLMNIGMIFFLVKENILELGSHSSCTTCG